jgi:YidC/Oxa1 family membrane protein insertase
MDRRSLLALFLIALVFIATPYYFKLISPEPPIVIKEKEPSTIPNVEPAKLIALPKDDISPQNIEEKTISVDTPLYSAEFSTYNGGSIKSYKLKDYLGADSSAVNLIFQQNLNNLFMSFVDINGTFNSLSNSWNTSETNHSLDVYDSPVSLEFYRTFGKETIVKTIEVDPQSYVINIVTDLTEISDDISGSTYTLGWEGGLPPTETNLSDDVSYFNGYVFQADDAYEFSKVAPKLKKSSNGELAEIRGATEWAAVKTKYFAAVLLPKNGSDVCWGGQKQIQMGDVSIPLFSMAVGLEKDRASTTALYLGPLEYSSIKKVNAGIPSIMNFGFSIIRPISKGVLWLLKSLHVWIPNYGIVLILFSILVKILVYPLTKKSHQSSKEMQALQPEIAILKEKHKNNPQKLNQATMGLYKEHGVNPLGGCLPILLCWLDY